MNPALSVIISVKNQSSRLALTLAALEVQPGFHEDYEVLVVDDGSREPVRSWLLAPASLRPYAVRVLETSSSGRRGVPRNRGAREARGAVLVFLDADACPSSGLLSAHWKAHTAGRARITLGDCHVIQATESFEDLIHGIRFDGFRQASTPSVAPLCLKPEDIRLRSDAALEPHAVKGIYPNQVRLQRGFEDMLSRCSPFAWAGIIPHNLSMTREAFDSVGGFNEELLHLEGWDLGIRALMLGIPLGWEPDARSFHLYHWRPRKAQRANAEQAVKALQLRYPGAGIEAILTWCNAISGSSYIPAELNLSNVQTLEEWFARPGSKARFQALNATFQAPAPLDYWHRAINAPFRTCNAPPRIWPDH